MDQVSEEIRWLEGRVTSLEVKEKVFSNGRPGKHWVLVLDEQYADKKLSGFGEPPAELLEAAEKKARISVSYTMHNNYRNYGGQVVLLAEPKPPKIKVVIPGDKRLDGDKQVDLIGLLTQAHDAFVQVYGREPKTEGEFAVCNTAFIWLKDGR